MSSIEPDYGCDEMDRGEKISGGFVVARGDGPELLQFAEEILDEVTRLIEFLIKGALVFPRALGRDDGDLSLRLQARDHTFVGVKGFVGKQDICCHLWEKLIGAGKIVGLAWG